MHIYLDNFNIRVFATRSDAPLFTLENCKTILDIQSDTSLFKTNATINLADPFLFVKNNRLYLFYERLDTVNGKGRLCMRSTEDLDNWTEEIDILREPFHLSFPFVFEDGGGKIYLLPESGENRCISLYEAVDNSLTRWKMVTTLREDIEPWYDSMIYKKDNNYYLFTGHHNKGNQVQHLFVSNKLTGPFKEHPKSPIYTGLDGGRNAGSIIESSGNLFRPVQICLNSYGENTSIMKIDRLTPTDYKETSYKQNIIDISKDNFKLGGHQWNQVIFHGHRIIAIDYKVPNYNIIELIRRIRLKFH